MPAYTWPYQLSFSVPTNIQDSPWYVIVSINMNMSQREAQADINQFREGKQGDDASMVLQSSGVVEPLFSWFQEANKVLNEPIPIETGCHQEMFLGLRDGVQQPTSQALVVTEAELLTLRQYKEEFIGAVQKSNGTQNADMDKHSGELKRKQNNERPKRTRSAEVHNMSEKRRRERIRVKMRALQELIPNSHKGDKASMLDDVIEYLKALKKQVEMLSMGRNAMFQVPYMSSAGIQGVQLPQFPPFLQMRPNPEMGMPSICGSLGFPMMPPSSAYLHPSIWATAGWHLMAIHGSQPVHQIQVPFVPSQPLTAVTTPFAKMPISSNKFCKSSSCPNQGYSGSQTSGCRTTGC